MTRRFFELAFWGGSIELPPLSFALLPVILAGTAGLRQNRYAGDPAMWKSLR
jgi:hypothetical protein